MFTRVQLQRLAKLAAKQGDYFDAGELLRHVENMESDRQKLADALLMLCAANNCNYTLENMQGMFSDGMRLLEQCGLDFGPEVEVKGVSQGPEVAEWMNRPLAQAQRSTS